MPDISDMRNRGLLDSGSSARALGLLRRYIKKAPSNIAIKGTPIPVPTPIPALAPADNPDELVSLVFAAGEGVDEEFTVACPATVNRRVGFGRKSTEAEGEEGPVAWDRKYCWTDVGRTVNQVGVPVLNCDAISVCAAKGSVWAKACNEVGSA